MESEKLENATLIATLFSGLGILVLFVPFLLALGLWLLGVPLDWSSWKTYAGIAALWVAVLLA